MGGVDMLLNSLTSPGMVAASLAALAPGGRFVEIGKRGIWTAAAVAASRPDVSFQLVAIDFLSSASIGTGMGHMAAAQASGQLRPLPHSEQSMSNIQTAMRQMSQASDVPMPYSALLAICSSRS